MIHDALANDNQDGNPSLDAGRSAMVFVIRTGRTMNQRVI
jgi:hypothetical protein